MDKERQISAPVSAVTRAMLERHVRASGVKKGHLVEQALQHYLVALDQLPADVIVHPRLVVTRKSGDSMLAAIRTAAPNKALRKLMRDAD